MVRTSLRFQIYFLDILDEVCKIDAIMTIVEIWNKIRLEYFFRCYTLYPPASESSREVANLTERKNPHPPVYGVKEFVCLL